MRRDRIACDAVRVAVVDVGTNSTRLLDRRRRPGRGARASCGATSIVTRLGAGVDATGRLDPAAQARVLAVLDRYAGEIRAHGCASRRPRSLTSAVRDAADGAAFAAAAGARLGLDGAHAERRRGGGADVRRRDRAAPARTTRPSALVIDIGGGSTELVRGARGRIGFHVSTQIGVVRHRERHLHADPPARAELAALAADVDAALAAAVPAAARARWRGPRSPSPAPPRRARRSTSRSSPTTPRASRGTCSSRAQLEALLDRLAALPLDERRRVPGLHPDRAPTIVAGVVVLVRVLDAFGLGRRRDVRSRHPLGRRLRLAAMSYPEWGTRFRSFWTFVRWRLLDTSGILGSSVRAVVPPAVVPRRIDPGDCRINRRLPPPGSLQRPPRHVPLPVLTGPT